MITAGDCHENIWISKHTKICVLCLVLQTICACTTSPPSKLNNLCDIFYEKDDWYEATNESYMKWRIPIGTQMAIMYQESHFIADAKPPIRWILGFIPWFRPSTAYGYAQAVDGTWNRYVNEAGSWFSDRDDFEDAADFIGWYGNNSNRLNDIPKNRPYLLYLAYHEGHRGYRRKSYKSKPWLENIAKKVASRAKRYQKQLIRCQHDLENQGWFF